MSMNKEMKPKLIVYDFDGVLTDNRVWVNADGVEWVSCHRGDGWWMGEIRKLGIEQLILSTEKNPVVSARGKKLSIEVRQGVENKGQALNALLDEKKIKPEDVLFIGNDMNDFDCFKIAGMTMAPNDSHPKILEVAKKVLPERGGNGIVRHLYDWIVSQ